MRFLKHAGAAAVAGASLAGAVSLNLQDPASIKSAASTLAYNMVQYYPGNQTGGIPGELGSPYYWWEAGAMFGVLIDYWYYTGDSTYNDIVTQGLLFQTGPDFDYMPPNQTKDEGNDDQVFWAFSVMTAAEYKFPNPPPSEPQWLALAQAVFNRQASRWDAATCGGGLRWQIFEFNNGYNYKNAPSNGGMMNLAARLYAYTGNETYATWVNMQWDWMTSVGLISPTFNVFDGTETTNNCTTLDHVQWTYSFGMLINAAAVMQNVTGNATWADRAMGVWKTSAGIFYKDMVMYESACEPQNNCDTDQLSFKAYYSRFLAASTKWMPALWPVIQPYIVASANAAAAQCDGGASGIVCGFDWTKGSTYDGTYGVGQQMCALEVIMANLINDVPGPATAEKGGISTGNVTLGTGGETSNPATVQLTTIDTSDRAGAGILTAVVLAGSLGGVWWLVL